MRMGLRKINGMNNQFKRGPNKEKECRYRKERKIEWTINQERTKEWLKGNKRECRHRQRKEDYGTCSLEGLRGGEREIHC